MNFKFKIDYIFNMIDIISLLILFSPFILVYRLKYDVYFVENTNPINMISMIIGSIFLFFFGIFWILFRYYKYFSSKYPIMNKNYIKIFAMLSLVIIFLIIIPFIHFVSMLR